MNKNTGFTLIELTITVAIIGIIAMIAVRSYTAYLIQSANSSCLYEAKAYSTHVFINLSGQNLSTRPSSPSIKACDFITDASSWQQIDINTNINALPRSPGNKRIVCEMAQGASCKFY